MITTRKHVEQHIQDVTPTMLGLATKIYDYQTKQNIYLVLSTSGTFNEEGEIEEYRVSYAPGKGFGCTCKSGQHGFWNVKHASGVCVHCRIAVACAAEERAYMDMLEKKAQARECSQCGQVCNGNGKITDAGMLAWMADRNAGKDINLGRPAWMMR